MTFFIFIFWQYGSDKERHSSSNSDDKSAADKHSESDENEWKNECDEPDVLLLSQALPDLNVAAKASTSSATGATSSGKVEEPKKKKPKAAKKKT